MTYLTVAGDSWDSVAFKLLGSERYAPELMDANPDHVQTFIFSASVELTIPSIETKPEKILPWQ